LSETNTKGNTQKTLAKTQYENIGKINVTSKEKPVLNLEKTLKTDKAVKSSYNPIKTADSASKVAVLMNEVINARNYIVEEISSTFEKKLEKLDDAILELINCKTENERLKNKIDNLTRENYRLKKENESYKLVIPGVFIKVKKDTISL